MKDSSEKISFKKLTALVKGLSIEENQFAFQEAAVVYSKKDKKSFDADWENGISSTELKELAIQHIHNLPWK